MHDIYQLYGRPINPVMGNILIMEKKIEQLASIARSIQSKEERGYAGSTSLPLEGNRDFLNVPTVPRGTIGKLAKLINKKK